MVLIWKLIRPCIFLAAAARPRAHSVRSNSPPPLPAAHPPHPLRPFAVNTRERIYVAAKLPARRIHARPEVATKHHQGQYLHFQAGNPPTIIFATNATPAVRVAPLLFAAV